MKTNSWYFFQFGDIVHKGISFYTTIVVNVNIWLFYRIFVLRNSSIKEAGRSYDSEFEIDKGFWWCQVVHVMMSSRTCVKMYWFQLRFQQNLIFNMFSILFFWELEATTIRAILILKLSTCKNKPIFANLALFKYFNLNTQYELILKAF